MTATVYADAVERAIPDIALARDAAASLVPDDVTGYDRDILLLRALAAALRDGSVKQRQVDVGDGEGAKIYTTIVIELPEQQKE